MGLPRIAYILLWFPKPSETFIFREVVNLMNMDLPIRVFTLYGPITRHLTPEMSRVSSKIERLGLPYIKNIPKEIGYWLKRDRRTVQNLFQQVMGRRPLGLEKTGENWWALLCAFRLARRFLEEGFDHIHAPWANGPATAAWAAGRLTGIPFSFTARAWDIYPPDNLLKEKLAAASFVRSETGHNIPYLAAMLEGQDHKFHLTYNGVPLKDNGPARVDMTPPYQLLALGRLVGKKGYDQLLLAARILKDRGLDFRLTLAGDGPLAGKLKRLTSSLDLNEQVVFPGFVTHDRVSRLFQKADIFIMPSVVDSSGDRDGIPLVLMEALLHNLPVVATNVSGIPELVEDRVTGLLIEPGRPEAIARAVMELTADRELALCLAGSGRERIQERFHPEKNYRKVFYLYKNLASGPDRVQKPS